MTVQKQSLVIYLVKNFMLFIFCVFYNPNQFVNFYMNGLNLVSISVHLCLFFFKRVSYSVNIQILVDKDFSREMIQLSVQTLRTKMSEIYCKQIYCLCCLTNEECRDVDGLFRCPAYILDCNRHLSKAPVVDQLISRV